MPPLPPQRYRWPPARQQTSSIVVLTTLPASHANKAAPPAGDHFFDAAEQHASQQYDNDLNEDFSFHFAALII
jgi:hypothetical protein